MMGSSQHGHMASIGYDLYCRMLEDTVKLLKGEIQKEPIETTLDIKVDAYIPESYIDDEIQKIEVYKKIAAIEGLDDYNDIKEELEDRYSKIPEPVHNLMDIAYIKSRAKSIFIEEVKENPKEIIFKFAQNESGYKEIFKTLMEKYKKSVVLKFGDKPYFAFKLKDIKKESKLEFLKEVFNDIIL